MKKILLNIQLFADGETVSLNTTELLEYANEILGKIGPHITELATDIITDVNAFINSEEFKNMTSEAIQVAIDLITPYVSGFQDELSTLGQFVIDVVNSYELSDETLKKEFENWGTTIKASIEGIKTAATTSVGKGEYSFGQYVTDMSENARAGVTLATKAITDTTKVISSATGVSVVDSLKNIGEYAVGTFNTLFSWIGNGGQGTGNVLFQ